MRFIKTDLKRVFTEPSFLLSEILGLVLLFGAAAYLIFSGETENIYERAQALALPFAAPILAAMPYSVMIMQERETRFGTLMTAKLGKGGYELQRLAVCGISGAAALFLPQLAFFAVCAVMDKTGDISSAFAGLALPVSFGFGYAAFSCGLTFVNRQRYIPLVMPQVLYLLCIYAFPHLGLNKFYPPLDIAPSIYGSSVTAERFAIPLALTAASVFLAFWGIIRRKAGGES